MTSNDILTDNRTRGFVGTVKSSRYAGLHLEAFEAPDFAIRSVADGSRVLDVGCGAGGLASHLRANKACNVVGIEPNPDRAASAAGDGVTVHVGFLTRDLSSTLGKFDAIIFLDVLEHAADPLELLEIAKGTLNETGRIIISVPNVAHWTVRLMLLSGRFNYRSHGIMDATHLRWFTAKTVHKLALAAGLRVVEQTVSRGAWMSVYSEHRPLLWLSEKYRRTLLGYLCHFWPGLFGCQHLLCLSRT